MKNWAKSISFTPSKVYEPSSIAEVQSLVEQADRDNKVVRTRGSAHSWTDLINTSECFVHLDHLQGLLEVDKTKSRVRALAGTKLYRLSADAFNHDLAMENQGDIDKQSLAGATSTGTHGTGLGLRSISNQITELKLVTADGDLLVINPQISPDLFDASRVSFGSLGIMVEAQMQMQKAYRLCEQSYAVPMDHLLPDLMKMVQQHRHMELFYFPVGKWAIVKIMDQTQDEITPTTRWGRFNEVYIEGHLYEGLNILAGKTKAYKKIDHIMSKFVGQKKRVGYSHQIFPTERNTRFMEMEYNLPVESFQQVFSEIQKTIQLKGFQTLFPIEIRFVQGDPIWLSPAYQRDSVYFAIHTYITEDYRPYFEAVENIFKSHGGRPHWGKWHTSNAKDFVKVYPRWNDFYKLREKLDPKGRFLNPHLKEIFGY